MEFVTGKNGHLINYLDDFLILQDSEESCNAMVSQFMSLCDRIGCPLVEEKTESASTTMIFLGMLMNGNNCTISIPMDKVEKALNLLNWIMSKQKVTIKLVQRLTGTLNFLNKAVIPARAFTRRMYERLTVKDKNGNPLKQFHHVSLNREFKDGCRVWQSFLMDMSQPQLCRPFIDIEKDSNAIDMRFYTDTLLNSKLGMGGIFKGKHWFVAQWDPQFIKTAKPSIEFVELLALTTGILIWGDQMVNTRVILYCDNKTVQKICNKYASSCMQSMKLVRILALDSMQYNRHIFIRHIRSSKNDLADALSHLQFRCFWRLAPETMNQRPDPLPNKIWSIEKIWYNED